MRAAGLISMLLLSACVSLDPISGAEPAAHVVYGDLALETPADRAMLRQRVADAAQDYCREHEDEVTPDVFRNDSFYCLEKLRGVMLRELPGSVRHAYKRALREAGVKGRRL